jgi:hypothetical protein
MAKRKSKYYPFEQARTLIRDEMIHSIASYQKWYQHNKPNKIPKRPDIIYKAHGWVSWNDYLGNNNKFQHKRQFVSYEEARKWARSLGLRTYEQWRNYLKEGGHKPENIPARPDYYYRGWFTWKDYLGSDAKQVIKEAVKMRPILYVIKVSNTPSNVYKVDVTYGGKDALVEAHNKGAKIIAAFEYLTDVDWRTVIVKHANNYWNGEQDDYAFSNVNAFLFELSSFLSPIKF